MSFRLKNIPIYNTETILLGQSTLLVAIFYIAYLQNTKNHEL